MYHRVQGAFIQKKGANKLTSVIYKISDDNRSFVVKGKSTEKSYEEFLQKLTSSVDHAQRVPRYAVYDVGYDLNDDGRRCLIHSRCLIRICLLIISKATTVFISWVPEETSTKVRVQHFTTAVLQFHLDNHPPFQQ